MEEKEGSISEASTVEVEATDPPEEDLFLLRLEILAVLIRQNVQQMVPIMRHMWQTDLASRPDIDALIPEVVESILALYRFGAYRETVLRQREARRSRRPEGNEEEKEQNEGNGEENSPEESQSSNREGKEEGQN